MRRLYYDVESTGIIPRGGCSLEDMPRIVQLAGVLIDDEDGEISSLNVIIKPDGWIVPEGAAAVHGITTEKAERYGIPIKMAMALFHNILLVTDEAVAHNRDYDYQVVGAEMERLGRKNSLDSVEGFCTMHATTDLVKIPGKWGKYKWPKLQEVHVHFFGEEFEGAHDALADVRACARIHKYLLNAKQ